MFSLCHKEYVKNNVLKNVLLILFKTKTRAHNSLCPTLTPKIRKLIGPLLTLW